MGEELGEDGPGDATSATNLALVTPVVGEEEFPDFGDLGEGEKELLEAMGAPSVLEGVEVAPGGTGPGASTPSA